MSREFPRIARVNQLVQEIVADEIERIDDDRLGFLTVVGVEVGSDLRHAMVWFTELDQPASEVQHDEDLLQALEEHRPRIQKAIGRQARLKRTPELEFKPDPVAATAERVESILRGLQNGD